MHPPVRAMQSSRTRVHEDAFTGDRLETQVVAQRKRLRRFRALLQPDVPDAGNRGISDNIERHRRRHDNQDGVDALGHVGEASVATQVPDRLGLRMNRIDAITFGAQFTARQIAEPLAAARHADDGQRWFGDERGDSL